MQKQFFYTLIGICLLFFASCKKDNPTSNIVKVNIVNDKTDKEKDQKLAVNGMLNSPPIYWETGDYIRLVDVNNTYFSLAYAGAVDGIATFETEDAITLTNYVCYTNPSKATISSGGINYNIGASFTIDPADVDQYISDNMLLYTKNAFTRDAAGNNIAQFYPAMTIVEIPLRSDIGDFYIYNITLQSNGADAFITSANLPNVFNGTDQPFTGKSCTNTITYQISGNGFRVGAHNDTIKLLVWSNEGVSGLSGYTIKINDNYDYYTETKSRTTAFLNNKYYRAHLQIRTPIVGDWQHGGIVCYTYFNGKVKHGYVVDSIAYGSVVPWGTKNVKVVGISQDTGTGKTNTPVICVAFSNITTPYAAKVCDTLSRNGFSDWFLPSLKELSQFVYPIKGNSRVKFNTTSSTSYWTSSQDGARAYYYNFFGTGYGSPQANDKTNFVLPMREF